jgi:hypothetical protein
MSYESVKAALVDHITDSVGDWLDLEKVDAWPADPALVGSFEILPEGDEHWPCVAVTALRSTDEDVATGGPPGEYMSVYSVVVTVGCKSAGNDVESATTGRDRLLQAVRNLLKADPAAAAGVRVLSDITGETDPAVADVKGRPAALGRLNVRVRATETIPDLAEYGTADAAIVDLGVTDADGSLFTNQRYDGETAYDDPADGYDGGTEWPAKP